MIRSPLQTSIISPNTSLTRENNHQYKFLKVPSQNNQIFSAYHKEPMTSLTKYTNGSGFTIESSKSIVTHMRHQSQGLMRSEKVY